MKILITTEREIRDEDYWPWIKNLNKVDIRIDGKKLLETGMASIEDDLGYTKAITTYEIVTPTVMTLKQITEWLKMNIPVFFRVMNNAFEAEIDSTGISIKIYSDMSAEDFRDCRHLISEQMLRDGHKFLYNKAKIFQRRQK